MDINKRVLQTLKWKMSDAKCASTLKISLEEYKLRKKDILLQERLKRINNRTIPQFYVAELESKITSFEENLEKGTANIQAVSTTEPKSAEEIEKILKIDTNKWQLSSYWNKQHKDYWLISAMVTKKKLEPSNLLLETIKQFTPKPIEKDVTKIINHTFKEPVVGILSLQDLHFGKSNNDDVIDNFKNSISHLIVKAYYSHHIDKIYYVIGGDLLNMDTFSGTTTSGTPVENGLKAQEAYNIAFDLLHWSVTFLSKFCDNLEVIYLPGNHDRLSSYHMAHALNQCFLGNESIKFNVEYSERKVVVYKNNFFAFEHGDVNSKNPVALYATEFPKEWGMTKYRTCYTGHWHRKKTVEYVSENEVHGFSVKNLPSLSNTDYWHYHNKFTGSKQSAVLELHCGEKGKVSEFNYNV